MGHVEFWSNRLAATDPPLEISQTRIPDVPDQAEFVERWNEFHQGYRIAYFADGSEQRVGVLGEPFKEVSPGFLPRSLDQLRGGVENDSRRPENRFRRRRLSEEDERLEVLQPSLEDALDNLLLEASEEVENGEDTPGNSEPATLAPTEHETVGLTHPLTLQTAQQQLRNEQYQRVFGSREDIQQDDYESPLTSMYSRAFDRYRQAEERRADGTTVAPSIEGLSRQERRDIEEQLLWGVMQDSQVNSESLEREGNVWSYTPIPRTRDDDDLDLASSTSRLEDANEADGAYNQLVATMASLGADLTLPNMALHGTISPPTSTAGHSTDLTATSPPTATSTPSATASENSLSEAFHLRQSAAIIETHRALAEARHELVGARRSLTSQLRASLPSHSLDSQPGRPPPMSDESMTKVLACQVCYQQLADTAVLPCGHMVMCQWCADVVVPVRHGHIAIPGVNCPMCRRVVKQRFKIHM